MPSDAAPPGPGLQALAGAEQLLGVAHGPAERQLMLGALGAQLAAAHRRRAVALPDTLGPATRFDPRLPGFVAPVPGPLLVAMPPLPLPGTELAAAPGSGPDADADIAFAPITALSGWIRSGALSAVRLAEIFLARIDRLGPALECFALVTPEAALARAQALDRMLAEGRWLGPLHGIPYGMKDILDVAGLPCEWGAEPYAGRVATQDAHVTTLLHAAGAVLLGKTSVGALAYGDRWNRGRTRNPWNRLEGSSGSSAGSASAVAAGLAAFAIGTETLGSIVNPSARCGATGLRPTHGRVSRRGAMALCWSLDKVGPLCRSVVDTALVLDAIHGPDPLDAFQIAMPFGGDLQRPVAGLRLGYFAADLEHADADPLDRAALEAARDLGLEPVPLTRPDLPWEGLRGILDAEAAAAFEVPTLDGRIATLARQDAAAWPNSFRAARFLSAVDHVQLDRLRRLAMQAMDAAFAGVDAVLGPALVGPMAVITNFTGHPCLCLPAGFRSLPPRPAVWEAASPGAPARDVPHGVCLWGRLFDEGPMLAIGRALEEQLAVSGVRPPE